MLLSWSAHGKKIFLKKSVNLYYLVFYYHILTSMRNIYVDWDNLSPFKISYLSILLSRRLQFDEEEYAGSKFRNFQKKFQKNMLAGNLGIWCPMYLENINMVKAKQGSLYCIELISFFIQNVFIYLNIFQFIYLFVIYLFNVLLSVQKSAVLILFVVYLCQECQN